MHYLYEIQSREYKNGGKSNERENDSYAKTELSAHDDS